MMNRHAFGMAAVAGLAILAVVLSGCSKQQEQPPAEAEQGAARPSAPKALSLAPAATDAVDAQHLATAQKLINGGLLFLLRDDVRDEDGGWSLGGGMKPAMTAMALKALLAHPDFDATSPVVRRGFEVMLSFRRDDGGIYNPQEGMSSYSTAVAVMALSAARQPQFKEAIDGAVAYLKGLQIKPGSESPDKEIIAEGSPRIGGVSYGSNGEPNLSVLGMVVEAWEDAGVPDDDPHVRSAVDFLNRVQSRSESNPLEWAKQGVNDGGFVYDLKTSKAGPGPGGRGLRSYGSMTYVGFKSMLYAGVARDDPRVQAAYKWIRTYWRLDSNPNMPQTKSLQGLYYYYHVFAKALRAWGEPVILDTKKVEHNWRHELIDALAERAKPDGSWRNEEERWFEKDPKLATVYALLALEEALGK